MPFLRSAGALFLLLLCSLANAGVLITVYEPPPGYSALADYEFYLESPKKLPELARYIPAGTNNQKTSCDEPGWFAGAKGRVGKGVRQDIYRSSVGAVCGASSKSQAAGKALDLCNSRAPSGVTCKLDFVKYDPGTISFLAEYRPETDGSGGYYFKPRDAGPSDVTQFGCCHGKYGGLDKESSSQDKTVRTSKPKGTNKTARTSKPKGTNNNATGNYSRDELKQITLSVHSACGEPAKGQEVADHFDRMGDSGANRITSSSTLQDLKNLYRNFEQVLERDLQKTSSDKTRKIYRKLISETACLLRELERY